MKEGIIMSELYNLNAVDIDGNEFSFKELEGKPVLIVNTASKCGFTPQYEGLQKLHEKYSDKGLVILGFPSNDFLFQEPASNGEIKNFCLLNYGVDFRMFEKVKVRGGSAHPVYKFLVAGAGNPSKKGFIKWNFTKFLFDKNGILVDRYAPTTTPEQLDSIVENLI